MLISSDPDRIYAHISEYLYIGKVQLDLHLYTQSWLLQHKQNLFIQWTAPTDQKKEGENKRKEDLPSQF